MYLDECRDLSVTAKVIVALKVFERYCEANKLEHSLIKDFIAYIWEWPLVNGPDEFEPWENSRTELVGYGLGDPASHELIEYLNSKGIEEYKFREIVSGIVEMLWGNFWGAANFELTNKALSEVIRVSKINDLPPLTPFKFSLFSDANGWGNKPTEEDVEFWKAMEPSI